jgi:MFS family permease
LDNGPVVTEAGIVVENEPELRSIFSGRLRTTSGGLITLITMIAFEAMAVGPALPTAARELHALGAFGWAFTAFLVANVLGMVIAGQVCDTRGPRLPLAAGMTLFVTGLVVAGTATTMVQLVASRAVQGLGGGMLITAAYVVIGESYPERLRPKVFAATSSSWLVPSLLGPAISGALTQHASWRWVFLGLIPFVLAGCVLMVPVLRTLHRPARHAGLADPRRILFAGAVAAGVAALEGAGQHPSVPSLAIAAAGLVALGWGLRRLLPAGTFRVRPGVSAPVALRGLLSGAFFGADSVIPLMLTVRHGLGATAAGLPLTGAGLTWALGSWWLGRATDGDQTERQVRLLRVGYTCVAVAVALMGLTALAGVPWPLAFPAWLIAGLGAGLTMPTSSVLLLKHTTDAERGANSAALQLSDTTMAALTTGFAGVLVAAAARNAIGYGAAFVLIDAVMVAIALVGVTVSGRARTVQP